ncbi:cytochrome P450 [Patulibacter brassicae]|uniref:Cytochrome P450 n=1 Tax=Patulibacter brassicae TaxID=1705717 RepID=A0ABU4VN50_9ACTN|nr:cytochrome P450 [Patulibacter brassicae]MDX8153276.1 cytochrome P450 [Patulibacter brassicae]
MATTLDQIDLATRAFWAQTPDEIDAAFTVLRRENPVPWSGPAESDLLPPELNTQGFWSLTKYDDIRFASRHPDVFSSAEGITMETFDPLMTQAAQSFIAMDDPRHAELRGITMEAFKPANMKRMGDWVRGHARDLIDEMAPLGEGDFVELVSKQLPGRIFGSFFGLPAGEVHDRTIDAAQRLLSWSDPAATKGKTGLEHFVEAVMELHEIAALLTDQRRAEPGDDLMTWVIQAEFEGQRMDDDEIAAFFVLLAVAANDTTRHASAHAINVFAQHPVQKALLIEDIDGRVEGAVEEVLRWASPLLHMRRTATQDVTIGDAEIKAGDKVVLWYCSGNRDEDAFPDPFSFDILRPKNRHVAFGGGGPHYCLGAALARTMLRSLLSEVYTRIPDITGEPEWLALNFINGIERMPCTWTPPR